MDAKKFEERTIQQIAESLAFQKIKLSPLELINQRDRYFLVKCKGTNGNHPRLFLRYDQWFWLVEKTNALPPKVKRREYEYHVRPKAEPVQKKRQRPNATFTDVSAKLDKLIASKRKRPSK